MKIEVDTKQRINSGITFLLEFYKILMGTFLTLFVPHDCGGDVCTVTQNLLNDAFFHQFVFIFNLCSFIVFMVFYYTELKRENWCIKYLDIDPEKTANNLDKSIEDYPEYKKEMSELNQLYK